MWRTSGGLRLCRHRERGLVEVRYALPGFPLTAEGAEDGGIEVIVIQIRSSRRDAPVGVGDLYRTDVGEWSVDGTVVRAEFVPVVWVDVTWPDKPVPINQ